VNIICDTSIIVSFLNRLDLLGSCSHTFLVSDHVYQEVAIDYPTQQHLFQGALEKLSIRKIAVEYPEELELFLELMKNKRLSISECTAIAIAAYRGYFLASDDNQATLQAELWVLPGRILSTQDIVEEMINENLLSDADELLLGRATRFKFPTIEEFFPEDNLLQETSFQWGIFPLILKSG
jgi:hypothetical protein